ncbi:peptide deformylase [Rhodobacterales bacterium HKCCE4037]|nr:peptide deformylase [Rhodobacterales bacterium HKCCE4037]
MSVRPILQWPDKRLTQVCDPLDAPDPALIADLFDTMYDAPGRGLAAPQIGVMRRAFVIDVTWKEGEPTPIAFLNPIIRHRGAESETGTEQCLSIPGLPMQVDRAATLDVEWTDLDGQRVSATFTGSHARCIAHEYDHLDGIVIFDHQAPEARAKLEAAYGG